MRVHPITGRFAHGVAGGGTFVDGSPLDTEGQSGYACWLGDRVAYQWRDCEVRSMPSGGGAHRVETAQGVSWLAAGGNLWVGQQTGQVLTSWGHRIAGAGALGVALDGSAVFVIEKFQQDLGIARYRPGATVPDLVLADVKGPLLLVPYAQFSALDADRFLWRTMDGVLHTHGLLEPVRQPWPSFHPSLIDCGPDGVWVADGDGRDRLRVRPLDSLEGYVVCEQGSAVQARGFSVVGTCRAGVLTLGWSADSSDGAAAFRTVRIPLSTPRVTLTEVAPIPVIPFGPVSAALPEGTEIDLQPYVVGDPSTWPRTGTHPMHQVIDGNRVHFVKFGDPKAYETWSLDADWIHHLEDASNPETQVFTDTRWLPQRMRVGEAHAFSTGEHEAIWMRRAGCEEIRRGPYHRRMWVVAAWDRFSCGPDLGVRPVVCVAYDSTGGVYAPDRGVELYYFVFFAGWIRWEYHHSDRVFADGAAVFTDHTRKDRSDFYRAGGAVVLPALTTCAIAPSTPPETMPMQLHRDVVTLFRTYLAAFPVPRGDAESDAHFDAMRAWIKRFSEQVRFTFPGGMPGVGGEFGTKSAGDNRPPSKESLALRVGNTTALHAWDLFQGAATGQPAPNFDPDYHDIWNPPHGPQAFIAVSPVDHLGAIVAPTHRPTIRTPLWSVSSFDLGARLEAGDRRWLDQVLLPAHLVARVVVASVFRRPAAEDSWTTAVKLERAHARFRLTLQTLTTAGLQCAPTLLCDTKYFGLSRGEALAEVHLLNAMLVEYPRAIAGVRGGNELSGGNEQPYMTERAFWDEVDAILDPRFPFAPGAGHGGEGVSMLGGSYLVHHADRGLSAEANAIIMAEAQAIARRPVEDAEQIGIAEPGTEGQRVYHAEYLLQSVRECQARGLGGVTAHLHAGLTADVDALGPMQRDALAQFGALTSGGVVVPVGWVPPDGSSVTEDDVVGIVAGGFFLRIADHVGATGSVEQMRPKVYAWMRDRIRAIAKIYLVDVFKRPCDLEGYGSCMTAYLDQGVTDD